jgi:GNAT superfamily N-acetyltransferase
MVNSNVGNMYDHINELPETAGLFCNRSAGRQKKGRESKNRQKIMIRKCKPSDIDNLFVIINDAAIAYKGVIPDDRWQEPYMSVDEIKHEIKVGVVFWGFEQEGRLIGVMGIQDKGEVTLIRHAYVHSSFRRKGIGEKLLRHLEDLTDKPLLIGTWKAASWAVSFYQKNGYHLVSDGEKNRLLRKYWSIPQRQIETSVVLSNQRC